jgi:hypothetical protein
MPPPDETAIVKPPAISHLDVTDDDVAASFRPWVSPLSASPSDPTTQPPPDDDPLGSLFIDDTLHALVQALPAGATDTADAKLRRKAAALKLLRSLDAQEPIEAALASQAVLFHYASVAALRRATRMPPSSNVMAGYETASAARASNLFCRLLHELTLKQRPASPPAPRDMPRWRR